MEKLNGLSLFSGIGGIELGLSDYVTTKAYCEIDPYASAVLRSRMQDGQLDTAPIYPDIKELHGKQGDYDIITGGFPCQDISNAGKQAGIQGHRSGLWFEMQRLIREIRPRYVFVENVSALLNRGLPEVLASLAEIGYDAIWTCIRASDVGAPHRRERIFILAYPASNGREAGCEASLGTLGQSEPRGLLEPAGESHVADASGNGRIEDDHKTGEPVQEIRQASAGEPRRADSPCDLSDSKCTGLEGHDGNSPSIPTGPSFADFRAAHSSHWDRDPADCEPSSLTDLGRIFDGIATELDTHLNTQTHKLVSDGSTSEDSAKSLCLLWKTYDKKGLQWQDGGLFSIQAEKILRQMVYGSSIPKEESNKGCMASESQALKKEFLRDMWNNQELKYTSQGQQPCQCFYRELNDLVQFLSHKMALDAWEDAIEKTIGVQCLWTALRQDETRDVPKTLSEVQEVWQSKSYKDKQWLVLCSSGGLGTRVWPSTPRVTYDKNNRVNRIKCLGNGCVPQQAKAAFQGLLKVKNTLK